MDCAHPLLLEVNTRCWLQDLSADCGRSITLETVPSIVVDRWRSAGYTHIWLMGVWTVGARSREQALHNSDLRAEYDLVLPGWSDVDVLGSPYAIADYKVPEALGGMQGLVSFRQLLAQSGICLILDFVPNHVGLDHPWIHHHPDRFVRCPVWHPQAFEVKTAESKQWIAHGKDPDFSPWTDTAQLDYRKAEVHEAVIDELLHVSDFCDGVRCDMAMLLLKDVFQSTWKDFPPSEPEQDLACGEFWRECIRRVKLKHPQFLFLAEAYWNRENDLQNLGFDYTYDKRVTDALIHRQPAELTAHLAQKTPSFVKRSVHFLENHDEVRVASALTYAEHRAAALAVLALPGMRMLHEGQTTGARIRTPVQLGRRARETVDVKVQSIYDELFPALVTVGMGKGTRAVLSLQEAWSGNPTNRDVLVIEWKITAEAVTLVVVNLASHRGQCLVPLTWDGTSHSRWELRDVLGEEVWQRDAEALHSPGLFLDLPPHVGQIFVCRPLK